MINEIFDRQVEEIFEAIELCLSNDLLIPGLSLIYAGIDYMAWLSIPRKDVKEKDFVGWVERFLLPDAGFSCSGVDLYGARCGILHNYSAASSRSRKGEAKELYYHLGAGDPDGDEVRRLGETIATPFHVVTVGLLFAAMSRAVDSFRSALEGDPELLSRVNEKLSGTFPPLPRVVVIRSRGSGQSVPHLPPD